MQQFFQKKTAFFGRKSAHQANADKKRSKKAYFICINRKGAGENPRWRDALKLRGHHVRPGHPGGGGEPVTVAARTLAQYDLGALPACAADGKPVGLLTDRAS